MLIDGFTVIAQIVNFLILVVLLWHFLYKPILQTIKKRQVMIDERWKDAEIAQEKAQKEATVYSEQQLEFQQQQKAIMKQACSEVEEERQKLLEQAHREVEQIQAEWKDALAKEKDDFLLALRQKVLGETSRIVRYALRDLANADLEEQIVATFCQRLQQIDEQQRRSIVQSLANHKQPIIIYSSFEMPLKSRHKIIESLRLVFIDAAFVLGNDKLFQFKLLPDLICGIKVKLAGHDITWNLDDYLHILEEHLSTAFK